MGVWEILAYLDRDIRTGRKCRANSLNNTFIPLRRSYVYWHESRGYFLVQIWVS